MHSEKLLLPLNKLFMKAQNLLQFAQAENWEGMQEQFADYQQQMSVLTDQAFLQALKDENLATKAQTLILQIQELNQQLDSIAIQTHDNIASELRQLIQADKALDAYRR